MTSVNTIDANSIINLTDGARELLTRRTHAGMSTKYKTLTTGDTLQPFFNAGYKISAVQYGRTRSKEVDTPVGLAGAHIVRLRHPDFKIGSDFVELVIANSYDGSCKYSISLGIYRLVCTNGLTVGQSIFSRTIKHIGSNFYTDVNAAMRLAEESVIKLQNAVERIKAIQLTDAELALYAKEVFQERLHDVKNLVKIDLARSLQVERPEDTGNGLWEVMNVIQEKLLRGGVEYTHLREKKDDEGKVIELNPVHKVTRPVFNTQQTMRLNQLVFDRALAIAEAA